MIKDRIIQLIEYKSIPKEQFYIKIGMTSANFRGKARGTPLNSNAIANILSEIPDVNADWLLTGNGKMLKGDSESPLITQSNDVVLLLKEQLKEKEEEIKIQHKYIGKLENILENNGIDYTGVYENVKKGAS